MYMESNLQPPSNLVNLTYSSDAKNVARLSTIMVASIQEIKENFSVLDEMKDRVSQIEYMFCCQLYPNIQMKAQGMQNIYSEAREHAELAYLEKEKELLLRYEKLQSEKQQYLDENKLLKLEKERMESQSNCFKELQEELKQKTAELNNKVEEVQNLQKLLKSQASLIHSYETTIKSLEEKAFARVDSTKSLEVKYEELQQAYVEKSREVEALGSLIVKKDEQLKEYEEKEKSLDSKLEIVEKEVFELQSAVDTGKELQRNLLKKIEFQGSEVIHNEQLLSKRDVENKLLADKIKKLANEVEERRNVRDQLLKQIDSLNLEKIARGQELDKYRQEKKLLLDIQKDLEVKVDKLQQSLNERSKESFEAKELNTKLQMQIKEMESRLSLTTERLKRTKSEYLYACKKLGCIPEAATPNMKIEDESETIRDEQPPVIFNDVDHRGSNATCIDNGVIKHKVQMLHDNKSSGLRTSPVSPHMSSIPIAPKEQTSTKSCLSGTKRLNSYWRDTRSHQSRVGPDPHDDFLDTPLEKVRGNLGKARKEQQSADIPNPGLGNVNSEDSNDETQDMKIDREPQKEQMPPPKPGPSGFKYVEPVRKKQERDNLKGVECKQCAKFYDAVLPQAGENADGTKQRTRCEHQDGVSRHRYRYAPPSTPEGFWNIGFESEM